MLKSIGKFFKDGGLKILEHIHKLETKLAEKIEQKNSLGKRPDPIFTTSLTDCVIEKAFKQKISKRQNTFRSHQFDHIRSY